MSIFQLLLSSCYLNFNGKDCGPLPPWDLHAAWAGITGSYEGLQSSYVFQTFSCHNIYCYLVIARFEGPMLRVYYCRCLHACLPCSCRMYLGCVNTLPVTCAHGCSGQSCPSLNPAALSAASMRHSRYHSAGCHRVVPGPTAWQVHASVPHRQHGQQPSRLHECGGITGSSLQPC